MKMERKLELFVETCMKYLKGLYHLKRIVSGYEILKVLRSTMQVEPNLLLIFFFKGQYGSKHIILLPQPGFRKSGECRILKDVMVQLRTI